jgi:hypothetical protein
MRLLFTSQGIAVIRIGHTKHHLRKLDQIPLLAEAMIRLEAYDFLILQKQADLLVGIPRSNQN